MTPLSPHRLAFGLVAAVLAVWTAAMTVTLRAAALPPEAAGTVLAVFPPTLPAERALAAVVAAGGRPLRDTAWPGAWIANGDDGFAGRLSAEGAVLVLGDFNFGPTLAGCTGITYLPQRRG